MCTSQVIFRLRGVSNRQGYGSPKLELISKKSKLRERKVFLRLGIAQVISNFWMVKNFGKEKCVN